MHRLSWIAASVLPLCLALGSCAREAVPADSTAARAAEVHEEDGSAATSVDDSAARADSDVRARVDARIEDARARHAATLERMNRVDARRAGR